MTSKVAAATAVIAAISAGRTGIRLAPFGRYGDMQPYPDEAETWIAAAETLSAVGPAYIHPSDQLTLGQTGIPDLVTRYRNNWPLAVPHPDDVLRRRRPRLYGLPVAPVIAEDHDVASQAPVNFLPFLLVGMVQSPSNAKWLDYDCRPVLRYYYFGGRQ